MVKLKRTQFCHSGADLLCTPPCPGAFPDNVDAFNCYSRRSVANVVSGLVS
jgi:hypothetical protein